MKDCNCVNVLLAIDHLSYGGHLHGAGRVFMNVVATLDRRRFSVVPCVLRKEAFLQARPAAQGIGVRCLGRGRRDPGVLLDLVSLIKKERIHILHLHQYSSSMFGRLAGLFTGVRTVIHGHGIDYSYSWYQQVPDWLLARFTDRAIVVSEAVKEVYVKRRKIAAGRVVVMPNGIPLESFRPVSAARCAELKRQIGLEQDHFVVGTVTRLREEKGNRYFLEAAAEVLKVLPATYFLLVGDGPLRDELRCLAERLGIAEKVIFAGFRQDVASMLSVLDVKVVASITEGQSLAIVEAMAMGKAVVATDVDGLSDVLSDGRTGLLVPPRDSRAMAEKIIYLLQHKEERVRLGTEAHRESRDYSLEAYTRRLEALYAELAGRLAKPGSV